MSTKRRVPNRDSLASIDDDGSHIFLHPADVKGRFTRWRRFAGLALILIYVLLPWIPINGFPAVFLDLQNLRFHFFGLTLAPQDLWLAFFLVTGLGFGLFYVTAFFGRIWCGWACPQTVFLEHVYRRIERWIEGDAPKRRQLDKAPWTRKKIVRRVAKHGLFILVSLLITHLFAAYFLSLPQLWGMMRESPLQNWATFVFLMVASAILYFNFGWFREQLCIIICPYGRLQSALIDDNSVVIGYDQKRGEPRGRVGTEGAGDCIACNRCVQVCPTGIDIRQGLQMECIGCANCIDACDDIMAKVKRPQGLIRYDSLNGLAGNKTRYLRPRTLIYTGMLLIGAIVMIISLHGFKGETVTFTRLPGAPYFQDNGAIRNQFMVRLINKETSPVVFHLKVSADEEDLEIAGFENSVTVAGNGEELRPLVLVVPSGKYHGSFDFTVDVHSDRGSVDFTRELTFLGPDAKKDGSDHGGSGD